MPITRTLIDDLIAGDDRNIERTITGVMVGDFLAKAWFTVKELSWDADDKAVIQKIITPVYSSGSGVIGDTGEDGTADITFEIPASDSIKLRPGYEYSFDIQLKSNAGKTWTGELGVLVATQGITSATS
jgi:hypothetical protein